MNIIKLINDDGLEVMKAMSKKDIKVDMVLTDLPFKTTQCHWDGAIDFNLMWICLNRVINNSTPMLFFAQIPFSIKLGASNLKMLRYNWIWEKNHPTGHYNAKKMPMKAHEEILVFYKRLPLYNPIKTKGHERKISSAASRRKVKDSNVYGKDKLKTDYDSTERYPRSVLRFPTDKQKSNWHENQKPIALLKYLIETYTNPGDTVLDFTAGSFSTAIACMDLDRNCICAENDEEIYNRGLERIRTERPDAEISNKIEYIV